MRRSRVVLAALATAPVLVAAGPAALASAAPSSSSLHLPVAHASVPASLFAAAAKTGTTPVVVVLKSNVGVTSPDTRSNHTRHAAALASAQSPVLSLLSSHRASKVHPYASFGEIAATVDAGTLTALSTNPAVAAVVPDATLKVTDPTASARAAVGAASGSTTTAVPSGVCSAQPSKPQLNPEALQTTHTDSDDPTAKTARSLGATGAGVKVAFFAEGIDVDNPDFIRPDGSKVFIDYQDFSGDGTSAPTSGGEAFLDASSIAAQGNVTYNVKSYGDTPPGRDCYIRVEGVAPGASLVGLKIFGNTIVTTSGILQAIDYAVNTDHVDILSQSLGNNPFPDTVADAFRAADAAAVASGVTVVASTGDAGITNTIGSPATQAGVIGAGASTTLRAYLQSGDYLHPSTPVTGYLDNNISSFSSSGTDEAGDTISLVAPGDENWVVCTPDTDMYADCADAKGDPTSFETSGGTSESAPLVAGGAALVIQAYRSTHGGDSPTPAQVQQVLLSTADDIDAPADQQGVGELDTYRAVLAAESLPGSSVAPQGNTFLSSTNQIDAAAAPGTAVTKSVTLTNTGSSTQTITATTRALGAYTQISKKTETLSASGPTVLMNTGLKDPYAKTQFTVPAGKDRLDASIAWQASSSSLDARVRMELIDPSGKLAGLSRPQGDGNYGDFQVDKPAAGTWTAYFWTNPGDGSFGPIVFGARVANYTTRGSVSPSSLTLAPGKSGSVTVSETTPSSPGDSATSVVLTSNRAGVATTIPVILRSIASTSGKAASFTGTLTGGNGRDSFTGQEAFYQVQVPQGTPELNATVTLANNPDNPFFVYLVDPNGDALGNATNLFQPSETGDITPELSATTHALAPTPGLWDVIVVFAPAVSGTALSQPFTVSLDGTLRQASATGLPQSGSVTLPAGKAQTVEVTVTNTSKAPEAYFLDARLTKDATYTLAPLAPSSLTLPDEEYFEAYSIPTDSVEYDASLSSSVPVQFDTDGPTGDPDIEADSIGDSAASTYQAQPVAPGAWGLYASEVGPYGAVGAPTVNATVSGTVRTLAFDTEATSPTGDLWLQSVDASADLTPVVVQPGHSATIPVTITPKGNKGTVVSGVLFVDDLQLPSVFGGADQPQADQETSIPYTYKIG